MMTGVSRVVLSLADGLEVELPHPPTMFGKRIIRATTDPNVCDVFTFFEIRDGSVAVFRHLARLKENDCNFTNLARLERDQLARMEQAAIDAYKPITAAVAPTTPLWYRVWAFPVTVRRFERVFETQGEPFVGRWIQAVKFALPTVRSRVSMKSKLALLVIVAILLAPLFTAAAGAQCVACPLDKPQCDLAYAQEMNAIDAAYAADDSWDAYLTWAAAATHAAAKHAWCSLSIPD